MKFKVPKTAQSTPEEVKLVVGGDVVGSSGSYPRLPSEGQVTTPPLYPNREEASSSVEKEKEKEEHHVMSPNSSVKSEETAAALSALFGAKSGSLKKSNFADIVRQAQGGASAAEHSDPHAQTYSHDSSLPTKPSEFGHPNSPPTESLRDAHNDSLTFSRKGSYNQEGSSQGSTRGKWFAVKQITSFALANKRQSSRRSKPEDLITEDQVRAYHDLLSMTKDIKGLHACVDHPCGNIYWDFKTQQCLPGRVWEDTMPDDIRAKVDRDFTPDEVALIEEAIHLNSAQSQPEQVDPRALFVIGPAAAGKSAVRVKTEDMLQINLADYVEIDGDEFREKHHGWMEVLNSDPTTGYREALNVLLPYTRSLKKRFLEQAIQNRKNIMLPSTGSNFEKLLKEVEAVRARGYRVDVIGLVVSYHETRARAVNRAHVNGRWNVVTWKKWEAAMHAITYFMDPTVSDWCIVFDNHDFTNPTTIYTRTHNLTFVESIVDEYRRMDQQKEREEGEKS
eukprot:TRINITY_DN27209_c3_g1_i1.p2 TRINITY_DN27209_c3_g1~~TRINITY_DN27209_c3_g1_i1.p2  ORF type:complete len:506 (+),score=179.19 TRINITY_DN27209_c3_g1_i1:326-1843(+)